MDTFIGMFKTGCRCLFRRANPLTRPSRESPAWSPSKVLIALVAQGEVVSQKERFSWEPSGLIRAPPRRSMLSQSSTE
jgi:hypothetical protein